MFTRTGYTQTGWTTADGGEKIYGLDAVYTQNEALTLYPVWNANKYTITFDTAGGSEIASITQDYGTRITAPANPTREGYTFTGWDRDIPATMPAHNMTVTAQWKDSEKPTGEIKAETATPQPTVTPQPTQTAQPQPTVQPVSPIPSTGDTANPALWFALLIVSGSALAAISVLRRKANRK